MVFFKDKNYCRLCLQVANKLTCVFENDGDMNKYIHTLFAVEITRNDPYSTSICQNCLDFIIAIIRQRVRFRENDKLLKGNNHVLFRNPDSEQQNIVPKEEKKSPERDTGIHPSVERIFERMKNVKLAPYLCNNNYDVSVAISSKPEPWPRRKSHKKIFHAKQKTPHKRKSKNSYENDPSFSRSISIRKKGSSVNGLVEDNDTEKSDEAFAEGLASGNIAAGVKKTKRLYKSPERFGDTIFYAQYGIDALAEILPSEETQYTSPVKNFVTNGQ